MQDGWGPSAGSPKNGFHSQKKKKLHQKSKIYRRNPRVDLLVAHNNNNGIWSLINISIYEMCFLSVFGMCGKPEKDERSRRG